MYRSRLDSKDMDALFDAILSLDTMEDCHRFFDDLCTITELQALVQRFSVAMMLDKGLTYHEIAEKTGASTATISRVNRCLAFGADGYKNALERIKEKSQENTDA